MLKYYVCIISNQSLYQISVHFAPGWFIFLYFIMVRSGRAIIYSQKSTSCRSIEYWGWALFRGKPILYNSWLMQFSYALDGAALRHCHNVRVINWYLKI